MELIFYSPIPNLLIPVELEPIYGTVETQVTQEEMLLTWTVENREEVRLPDNIVDIVDIVDLFRQY